MQLASNVLKMVSVEEEAIRDRETTIISDIRVTSKHSSEDKEGEEAETIIGVGDVVKREEGLPITTLIAEKGMPEYVARASCPSRDGGKEGNGTKSERKREIRRNEPQQVKLLDRDCFHRLLPE